MFFQIPNCLGLRTYAFDGFARAVRLCKHNYNDNFGHFCKTGLTVLSFCWGDSKGILLWILWFLNTVLFRSSYSERIEAETKTIPKRMGPCLTPEHYQDDVLQLGRPTRRRTSKRKYNSGTSVVGMQSPLREILKGWRQRHSLEIWIVLSLGFDASQCTSAPKFVRSVYNLLLLVRVSE